MTLSGLRILGRVLAFGLWVSLGRGAVAASAGAEHAGGGGPRTLVLVLGEMSEAEMRALSAQGDLPGLGSAETSVIRGAEGGFLEDVAAHLQDVQLRDLRAAAGCGTAPEAVGTRLAQAQQHVSFLEWDAARVALAKAWGAIPCSSEVTARAEVAALLFLDAVLVTGEEGGACGPGFLEALSVYPELPSPVGYRLWVQSCYRAAAETLAAGLEPLPWTPPGEGPGGTRTFVDGALAEGEAVALPAGRHVIQRVDGSGEVRFSGVLNLGGSEHPEAGWAQPPTVSEVAGALTRASAGEPLGPELDEALDAALLAEGLDEVWVISPGVEADAYRIATARRGEAWRFTTAERSEPTESAPSAAPARWGCSLGALGVGAVALGSLAVNRIAQGQLNALVGPDGVILPSEKAQARMLYDRVTVSFWVGWGGAALTGGMVGCSVWPQVITARGAAPAPGAVAGGRRLGVQIVGLSVRGPRIALSGRF